jgi:hypothetical protein
MFHDLELTRKRGSQTERFEVDGANAARDYLKARNRAERHRSRLDFKRASSCLGAAHAWSDARMTSHPQA